MLKRFSSQVSVSKILRIFGQARFPQKKHCLKCKSRSLFRLTDGRWECSRCYHRFSLKTNTYLQHSRVSYDLWYELLYWFAYEFTANRTARERSEEHTSELQSPTNL